jgi:ribose 1,5-bisphosphate isomerase
MVNRTVLAAYNAIKSFKVQGATAVALTAIEALKSAKTASELRESARFLSRARPTEPMARNGLRYVVRHVDENNLRSSIAELIGNFEQMAKAAMSKVAEYGSHRVQNGMKIMTICHSSALMAVLKEARDAGKHFEVYACETRPQFQGRITAQELSRHGIPVTLITDAAMGYFINKMDLALVGADVLTSDGYVVNKIGTSLLALCADEADTQFGVVTELLKFDPATAVGDIEKIEERPGEQVWSGKPAKVRIANPIFDVTSPKYVKFIATEAGLISPFVAFEMAREAYPWMMEDLHG